MIDDERNFGFKAKTNEFGQIEFVKEELVIDKLINKLAQDFKLYYQNSSFIDRICIKGDRLEMIELIKQELKREAAFKLTQAIEDRTNLYKFKSESETDYYTNTKGAFDKITLSAEVFVFTFEELRAYTRVMTKELVRRATEI